MAGKLPPRGYYNEGKLYFNLRRTVVISADLSCPTFELRSDEFRNKNHSQTGSFKMHRRSLNSNS